MRNQTYAYKLVLQIFAQVVILVFTFDKIDSTSPVQDIMSPSFDKQPETTSGVKVFVRLCVGSFWGFVWG